MKYIKKILITGLILFVLAIISILGANWLVEKSTSDKIYNSTDEVPYNKVGLLLGTVKYLDNGQLNLYYKYRIEAAFDLYKSGKIDFILVSGDNSQKHYDEPTSMKNDLIEAGVLEEKIFLDYAGFRTYDSVIRCKEIFGQKDITVISQQFHNERAIYIAKSKDMNAIGYNAKGVSINYGFKTVVRERFARVKMFLDLILGKKPRFLGEKIEIE